MKAKLSSVEILPRPDGLTVSPAQRFGDITTFVLGPNGAGKTPLLRAIAHALGNTTPLPEEIQARCSHVVLALRDGESNASVRRPLSGPFAAECFDGGGEARTFAREAAFSAWLLERLGVPPRSFAGKAGSEAVPPYASVLLPVVYVDQDFGWAELYSPPKTHDFIKDQREEVLRWVLGAPSKRAPVDKKKYEEAKTQLGGTQEQIAFKRRALEALVREVGADGRSKAKADLVARKAALLADLASANSVLESLAQSETKFDRDVREAVTRRADLQLRLSFGAKRKADILRARDELSSEVEILETNEVAAEAFRTLCGNEACEFFRRPEESYGRRLLFLKDQLKDFETSFADLERELTDLDAALEKAQTDARDATAAKMSAISGTRSHQLVTSIEGLTRELTDVSVRLDRVERVERERSQLEALVNRALREEEEVKELQPRGGGTRSDDSRVLDCRAQLAKSMAEWMQTLETQNVSTHVQFDQELRLLLGGRPFTAASASGSTRTRIVLAYHAAVLETSLLLGGNHPRFLILDAPKQQELHARDLAAFVAKFYALSKKHSAAFQLVVGATDPAIIPAGCADEVWQPRFGSAERPRYFSGLGEAK